MVPPGRGNSFNVSVGADFRGRAYKGDTLLHSVVQREEEAPEIIKYLVSLGLDVNARNDPGNTPLHLAARDDESVKVLESLVAAGADVNAKNNKGETPIHDSARENKNVEITKFLVAKGAGVDAKDNAGLTPFNKATDNLNTAVIEYLDTLP